MTEYSLTTGNDTVVAPASGSTVYGTAATLNAGDSLTGGTGTDVLELVGSGTFRIDQLATFTGFERIALDNATNSSAQLTLGSQPIEVDATGYLMVSAYSPSNWNGSDIIKGDASQAWPTTSLFFYSDWNSPQSPATYDLTSNSFSHIGTVYGNGNDLTLLVNSADTTNIQSFNGFGLNDQLVTASSTLDLSHTTISGFTVASTNSAGTTFTVGDLGSAFQIAGGSGHDTLIAQGFTLTSDQRTAIFKTSSIETIIDQSGTYAAPPPSPGNVSLTTGNDTVVAPASGSTVYGTAATLNAGDSLTGGTGTDVLELVGSGTFRIDQLATFTGFERIALDNATNSSAQLTLGSQPIEVDATGYLMVSAYSPSNWNGSDIIKGDASQAWPTTSLFFYSDWNSPQSPATYDLTSNSFSHIGTVYGNGNDLTLLVNSADTTNIQSFNGFGLNDQLVTASSTLDLSHTTISGFTVASTNSAGTTFTVGDLGSAFQIAGGSGHDTLIAQGFTLTSDQRTAIFKTSSIETIIDQSGTYAAPPPSPGNVSLTTGNDTVVAPASGSTVYGTAATLNAGDSLTGGTGTDVLELVGSGTFRIDQLATFTGFERIALDNATNSSAQLTLGSQPIEVDATGYLMVSAYSPSNWNGSDIIKGDASQAWPTTSLFFYSDWNSPQSPATYDLTSNSFSHIGTVYGNGNDLTLLVNSADTTNIQSFNGFGLNDQLVTASSTLDLSHTTISGFTVASTNSAGTTFTVGDLGSAFQIAGGSGHDTLIAQGFTLTSDQRTAIFKTSSIETIIDQSGTYPLPSEDFQYMYLASFDTVSTGGTAWELHDGTPAAGINPIDTSAATATDSILNGSSDGNPLLGDVPNDQFTITNATPASLNGTYQYVSLASDSEGASGFIATRLLPDGVTLGPSYFFTNTLFTAGVDETARRLYPYTGDQPICFLAGTMIRGPDGEVAVETIKRGDLLMTTDGRSVPVRWLGRQTISTRFADPLRVLPIRIKAGALCENVPSRDLLLSPDHAILVGHALIQAAALVDGTSIIREINMPQTFTYYHVELDDHSLILAENTPAETFIDNVDRLGFDNWMEHEALYPQGKPIIEMPYPRAKAHRQVPRSIREKLAERSAALFGAVSSVA